MLKNILSNSPDTLSSFLSSPVKMNTNVIYKVDNYGSAMAPFYSTLAIWVGGIVLVAMMKVTLEEDRKKQLFNVNIFRTLYSVYDNRIVPKWINLFGRFVFLKDTM